MTLDLERLRARVTAARTADLPAEAFAVDEVAKLVAELEAARELVAALTGMGEAFGAVADRLAAYDAVRAGGGEG